MVHCLAACNMIMILSGHYNCCDPMFKCPVTHPSCQKHIGYNCICVLLIVHMCSSVTAVFIRSGFGYQLIDRTRPLASWRFAISPSPTRSDPRTLACFRRIDQKPERDGAWNTRLTNRNRNDSHSQHEWHVLRGWAQ